MRVFVIIYMRSCQYVMACMHACATYIYMQTVARARAPPNSMGKVCALKRKRCHSDSIVFDAVRMHIKRPDSLKYRESLDGPCLPPLIVEHTQLLLQLRASTREALIQKSAEEGFMQLAVANEAMPNWHLGSKAGKWAEKAARKLRAMLRDVSQALHKERTRHATCTKAWLQPFWDAADAQADQAAPAKARVYS